MICVTTVGILSSEAMFPGELNTSKYLVLNIGTLMLWLAQTGIAFFFACLFSDSKYYYIFGSGIPVLFFFLQMLANMGGDLKFLKYFTIESLLKTERIGPQEKARLFCSVEFLGSLDCFYVQREAFISPRETFLFDLQLTALPIAGLSRKTALKFSDSSAAMTFSEIFFFHVSDRLSFSRFLAKIAAPMTPFPTSPLEYR